MDPVPLLIHPIELFVGAAILAAGNAMGYAAGFRHRQAARKTGPLCSCTHPLSYHDTATGLCHFQEAAQLYGTTGVKIGRKLVQCTCRQYVGEIPYDRILTTHQPAVTPEDDHHADERPE